MDHLDHDAYVENNPKVLYNWENVTSVFVEAVQDLELGELLHDDLFGLFEAMSAIEMMDPKMDAGMLCNRGTKKSKSFDESVQDNSLKLDNLSNSELIGIIDNTFACIVSWLEGHSLAQTVFINLYLHKPYFIEDRTLKAFSISVYKLLEVIKDYIHKAIVYEEEDFQPMQYGYHLDPDISEQRAIGMLREVEELYRKTKPKTPELNIEIEETDALLARITFMRVFYQCLITLVQRKEDQQITVTDCNRLLSTASDMLFVMHKSVHLGVQPKSENCQILGFEPLINQRLLPPTFPRYTKIKAREEALMYFEEIVDRFKTLIKIQSVTSLHQALDFFIEFSKGSPCILSRSALQLLYVGSNSVILGSNPSVLKDILKESAKTFISPPSLISKAVLYSNQQAKIYVDSFLSHCIRPFANLLQLCGHNRARQRDKLAHLLEEFTALQDEAERVDAYLHNITVNSTWSRPHLACFSTWILYHTLKIMIMYLLSGFELELYSIHEYYYIYWYLYEFLYGWLVSALTRADSFLVEQELITELQKSKGNKKKSKSKKKPRPYNKDILYFQALQHMCGGYYKALMGFRFDEKLSMPHPQFDSEQVRYEHRFGPFQNLITPPPVQYPEFRDLTSLSKYSQQPVDSMYLYIAGCKHFHQARQLLETVHTPDPEIVELLKISKTNFVVLKLVAGGHKKESTNPPEFDFSLHKHFPIIKLS